MKTLGKVGVILAGVAMFLSLAGLGIPRQFVDLQTPVGGEVWKTGTTQNIFWYGVELQGPYKIQIKRQKHDRWQTIANGVEGANYNWVVSGPVTRQATIKVTDIPTGLSDQNEVPFSIIKGNR